MIRPGALWEQRRHRLAVQKVQERCQKQEDALLKPRTPSALEQKLAPAAQKLQDAAPQKVRQGLETAFEKSFLALLARPELVGRGLRPAASGDESASLRQQPSAVPHGGGRQAGAGGTAGRGLRRLVQRQAPFPGHKARFLPVPAALGRPVFLCSLGINILISDKTSPISLAVSPKSSNQRKLTISIVIFRGRSSGKDSTV